VTLSFHRSNPLLNVSILTPQKRNQKKICTWEVTNISPFLLSWDRSFSGMRTGKTTIHSFSRPFLPQGTTSAANLYQSNGIEKLLKTHIHYHENEQDDPHLFWLFGKSCSLPSITCKTA